MKNESNNIHLDKDNFNPVMTSADLKAFRDKKPIDPKVIEYKQRLEQADHNDNDNEYTRLVVSVIARECYKEGNFSLSRTRRNQSDFRRKNRDVCVQLNIFEKQS